VERVLCIMWDRVATADACHPNSRLRRRPSMLRYNRHGDLCDDIMPHRLRSDGMGRVGDLCGAMCFRHFPTLAVRKRSGIGRCGVSFAVRHYHVLFVAVH
jgi:hypothetical protein